MNKLGDETAVESFDSVGHLQERRPFLEKIVGKKLSRSRHLKEFLFVCIGQAIATTASNIILVHKATIEEYLGLELQRNLLNIGFLLGGMIGLVLAGTISDKSWFNPLSLTRNVLACAAISPFLHVASETAATTFVLSAILGFFTGLFIGLYLPLMSSLLGPELVPSGLGFLVTVIGICQFILYLSIDQLVDFSSNPFTGFYTSGLLFGSAGLCYSAAIWLEEKQDLAQGMELTPLRTSFQNRRCSYEAI